MLQKKCQDEGICAAPHVTLSKFIPASTIKKPERPLGRSGWQANDYVADQPVICGSVSGVAGLSGSNHSSLNTIRFLCFIARLAVRAMMASAIATVPGHRRPPSFGESKLLVRMQW